MTFSLKKAFPASAVLAFAFTLFSCEKEMKAPVGGDGFQNFVIKAGEHDSGTNFQRMNTNKMNFVVVFDSSAVYKTKILANQHDINKLYGMSDCGESDHHKKSVRLGWRWLKNRLEIHGYAYKNSEPKANSNIVTTVPLNKEIPMSIELRDSLYVFTVDGVTSELKRGCTGDGDGNKLYPYFGGDEMAPHDITIKIKDL